MNPIRARLGDYVRARRDALGLTQSAVTEAGGPSDTRIASIEAGTGPAPTRATLAKLDTALQWAPGSAQRVLDGGAPVEIAAGTAARRSHIGVSQVSVEADELASLVSATDRLLAIAGPRLSDDPTAVDAISSVRGAVSALAGRWATDLLERNWTVGGDLPPIIELALGHHLDEVIDGTPEPQRTERLYRRFLSGRMSDISSSERAQFEARLARRHP